MADVRVQVVEPSRTRRLRRDVLRPWMELEEMSLYEGEGASVFAALDDETGDVVSTANVLREDPPPGLLAEVGRAGQSCWRLRGVATRQDRRGQGVGSRVIEQCVAHVAEQGGGLVWCNARTPARSFYERCGFVGWGDEFESSGIPHLLMWQVVDMAAPA